MKIVILEGSPNRNGSTHLLVESFANGAKETGHSVQTVDAAHARILTCTGTIIPRRKYPVRDDSPHDFRGGDAGFCYAALLLWNVGTAEDLNRSFLLF